jgi:hypothetical protein
MIIRSPGSVPVSDEITDAWYLAGGAPMPVVAYQPIGAASLADSYVNLVNPGTLDAAPGVAPTWASGTGWGFDGSTQYLTTGIVPASGYSVVVRFSDSAPLSYIVVGVASALGAGMQLYTRRLSGQAAWRSGGLLDSSPTMTDGVMGIAGQAAYRDGVLEGTIPDWTTAETRAFFVGANNNVGSPSNFFAGNVQAVAIYDTSTDHAVWVPAVSAAMAAL